MTICHCKQGVMSQCGEAASYEDQRLCSFFEEASRAKRCMFLNESMNNHCWSPDAQRSTNGIDIVDSEIKEMTLEDLMEEVDDLLPDKDNGKEVRQFCGNCIHLPCSEVKAEERRTGQQHLSDNELWSLGSVCNNYDEGGS